MLYGHALDGGGPDTDVDTAVFEYGRESHVIAAESFADNGEVVVRVVVTHNDGGDHGRDRLYGIEQIRFADQMVQVSNPPIQVSD